MPEEEKPINKKIWIMANEILRELPMECRVSIIEDIVKRDVRLCIENNGINDPICQMMAKESLEMEEYLVGSEAVVEELLKAKCNRKPCNLKIKGDREDLL